ncbi:hypothetical protein OCL06_10235 [Alteromonas sp. ASW11-19]|uniref:Uncharacterized protein n=1 Tax=Alteromonas salexigens TaxID=2982530 RepID=A0ABT2VQ26_9ALTE|nr:hypothetical protein [Alteromonas salexigens]MCU7554978.1 hypothetical protein [Alteromonas salexigens]
MFANNWVWKEMRYEAEALSDFKKLAWYMLYVCQQFDEMFRR